MPDRTFTMDLKSELAEKIEKLAAKWKIRPEYFCFFLVADGVALLEGLEKVTGKDDDLKDQLRDLVELRSLNALSDDEFLRELRELAELDEDSGWTEGA